MGIQKANSMAQMMQMNKSFWRMAEVAQGKIVKRLARINELKSKLIVTKGLIPYSGGGQLFGSIKSKSIMTGEHKAIVMVNDYGKGDEKTAEIEYGLKKREFRTYAKNPKLMGWVRDKWEGYVPPTGIMVGKSPAGIPHPKGLHYFLLGFLEAKRQSDSVITEELNKIG